MKNPLGGVTQAIDKARRKILEIAYESAQNALNLVEGSGRRDEWR